MPYKTKIEEPEGKASESPNKVFGELKRGLGGSTGGDVITGVIGEEVQESEVSVEVQDEEKRQVYISLLQEVLIPHRLGKLTSREENQERLFSKLDRLTLGELKRFVPSKVRVGKVEPQSIPINIRAEINTRYKDISP